VTAPTADCGKLTLADVVKRCMGRLERDANHLKVDAKCYFDGLQTKHGNLQGRVFELETAEAVRRMEEEELLDEVKKLRDEAKELRDEVKELRDEVKDVRDEIPRKRRTDAVDEIEEEVRKLKRRCGEI
jgi:uncharacterized protein YlxW (UPF0749 family)